MTHDEIDNAIAVMQAYKEGKTIQIFPTTTNELKWKDWKDSKNPIWDFHTYRYRIKPEPHYRPFKSAEEVMEAIKEHGNYIKDGNTYRMLKKFTIMENGEIIYSFSGWSATNVRTWNKISPRVTFADGTPFGVKED